MQSCEEILKKASDVQVTVASWFMMKSELRQDGDLHLRDEDDYMELVENGEFDVTMRITVWNG